jgi:hypothetical protein
MSPTHTQSSLSQSSLQPQAQTPHSSTHAQPIPSRPATRSPESNNAQTSEQTCRCKSSMCLKLYCVCFASGSVCSDACACKGCHNRHGEPRRQQAIESCLERNPKTFKPKVVVDAGAGAVHSRGCKCQRSHCLKKYCECRQAGVRCGEHCRCVGCKNGQCAGGDGDHGTIAQSIVLPLPANAELTIDVNTRSQSQSSGSPHTDGSAYSNKSAN